MRAGARVIVSIAGSTMGEYADLARRLSRAPGVAGLEVNVGAPDEVGAGLFEVREPYHSASVIAAVRREFPADRPVLAKLRPDVSRIVEGARSCHEAGATAVVIGNAVPAAFPDGRAGGLSGPAIAPVALRCVAEVHRALPDVPIIGCGGVHDLRSANAYLDAGASAVQVGTALLHDPTTVARLRVAALAPTPTRRTHDPVRHPARPRDRGARALLRRHRPARGAAARVGPRRRRRRRWSGSRSPWWRRSRRSSAS